MYDIDAEKKYIGGKLTKGKYLGQYPKTTDYAVLNGLKTNTISNQITYGEYWLANAKEVYESPRERDDPPDHYIQETSKYGSFPNDKGVGIRPAIKFSDIKQFCKIRDTYIYPIYYERDEEYLFVEFGEYPQNIVDNNLGALLTRLYQENKLKQTEPNPKYLVLTYLGTHLSLLLLRQECMPAHKAPPRAPLNTLWCLLNGRRPETPGRSVQAA